MANPSFPKFLKADINFLSYLDLEALVLSGSDDLVGDALDGLAVLGGDGDSDSVVRILLLLDFLLLGFVRHFSVSPDRLSAAAKEVSQTLV